MDKVKQTAISFAEWLTDEYWIRDPFPSAHTELYMWCKMGKGVRKTCAQLYEIFQNKNNEMADNNTKMVDG